jgi:hypothetical protein
MASMTLRERNILYLRRGILTVISLGIIGYVALVTSDYIRGPSIVIDTPLNGELVPSTVHIHGTVYRARNTSLNGSPIEINQQGVFDERILVGQGLNTIQMSTVDRFGRTYTRTLQIVSSGNNQ